MARRILTALVGIPLLVGAIWLGFPWLTVLVALIALVGVAEFYRIARAPISPVLTYFGVLWTILFVVAGQLADPWYDFAPHMLLGTGVLVSLLLLAVCRRGQGASARWLYNLAGPIYVGFLLAHALMLRGIDGPDDFGRNWLLFALLVTFATDTGALFTGLAIGRHKMAPSVSPGKTWEGAFGGFALAVGIALATGALIQLSVPIWQRALMGMAVGVVAQVGDLTESRLKRAAGVKDTSGILPGHGGVLDRLDSIVFALPVVYYLVAFALEPSE